MKVIGIGDNVCDKYVNSGIMYPGGQALNFSVYAKHLGADASYMGVFGNDFVAKHVISVLDDLKIEHSKCKQYDGENGYAKIKIVNGDRIFLYSNKGGVAKQHPLSITEKDLEYIKSFEIVHTSNNSHFNSQLETLYSAKVPISYDFSNKWEDAGLIKDVSPYVKYAFISCGSIPKESVQKLCIDMRQAGCEMVIATRGKLGIVLYDGDDFFEHVPQTVAAIDTLGAGDSFATAFLLNIISSNNMYSEQIKERSNLYKEVILQSMKKGAEFSAQICMVKGAFGHGIPFIE